MDLSFRGLPDLKWSDQKIVNTVCGRMCGFSDLPSPEEWILESIHAGQRKVEQSILGSLVPILPVVPERAIGVVGGVRLDAGHIEAAVVDTVAVFSGDSDTEGSLPWKIRSASRQRNEVDNSNTQIVYISLPGRTSLLRPGTSHQTIRPCDVDGVDVRLTVEREVGVRVESESIGVGEQTRPKREGADSVTNHNERSFAFANTRDIADDPVGFQVAS